MTDNRYRPSERMRTARLTLRPPSPSDAAEIFTAYATDETVTRYLVWQPHRSIDDTHDYLKRCDAARAAGTDFAFLIESRADGSLIGMIDVHLGQSGSAQHVSYGYVLRHAKWGSGYATEALTLLIDDALGHPNIFRAFAVCDAENRASTRVMEKAGMEREGVLRRYFLHPNVSDEPRDCFIYAKTR